MWGRAARIALVTVLCSCTATPPLRSADPTAARPVSGGRVVLPITSDVPHFTSWLANDSQVTAISEIIYRGLIRVDPKTGVPGPGLAESFDQSPDGRTLTFRLRQALRWSDGSELTGEDFRFTVEAIMRSRATLRRSSVQDIVGAAEFREGKSATIEGVSVAGRVVTVRFRSAFCPALITLGTLPVIPRSVFAKYHDPADAARNVDDAPEHRSAPLASGPFKLAEHVKGVRIVLERNDAYHGGPPLLDAIEFRVLGGTPPPTAGQPVAGPAAPARTAFQEQKDALLAGTADVGFFAAVERADRDDLRRAAHLEVRSFLGPRYTFIGWNQLRGGKEFFRSKAVRQALAYGLDVDAVLDKALAGEAVKVLSHTHPLSWAYDPTDLKEYRYDPRRAQQLLEQDGWTRGADGIYQKAGQRLSFTLTAPGNQADFVALQREAVQQYGQIGIEVKPETVDDVPSLGARLAKKDPVYGAEGGRDIDAFIARWVLIADPDAYSIWHSSQIQPGTGNNVIGYRDPVADRALEDGRTKCALAERKAAQRVLDRQLNEDQPYRFALAPNAFLVATKKLQGLDPSPFYGVSHLWNVERWWLRR